MVQLFHNSGRRHREASSSRHRPLDRGSPSSDTVSVMIKRPLTSTAGSPYHGLVAVQSQRRLKERQEDRLRQGLRTHLLSPSVSQADRTIRNIVVLGSSSEGPRVAGLAIVAPFVTLGIGRAQPDLSPQLPALLLDRGAGHVDRRTVLPKLSLWWRQL